MRPEAKRVDPSSAGIPSASTRAVSTTVIESLGVYLPPKRVTTREVMRGCHGLARMLPLETITGIKARRVVGNAEFAIDLAKQAVVDCLASSRHGPDAIDLLLCANISRIDGPDSRFTIEPSTSLLLKRHFGFRNALAFDVLNACAGVFTALYLADALIMLGFAERAMVVSGEYITHLTRAAQAVIDGVSDPRIACLTLGDAGMALILERSPRDDVGFHAIELFTAGRYSSCCIAKLTASGAWIMHTDYRAMAGAAFGPTLRHVQQVLSRTEAHPVDRTHLIPHQTSRKTLRRGARALTESLPDSSTAPRLIDNLAERGNTASTSHLVAVHDHVLDGGIRSGDRVMFAINGSGLTVGTALYTFDDLPDRLRKSPATTPLAKPRPPSGARVAPPRGRRARIESVGVLPLPIPSPRSSLELSCGAAERSLAASGHDRNAIELLLYAGVYRTDFVYEPAIATMIAGRLGINDTFDSPEGKRTLAFDVFNSSVGLLNACFLAARLIEGQKVRTALVVASEVENVNLLRGARRGITETASALILEPSPGRQGFGNFLLRSFTDHADVLTCSVNSKAEGPSLSVVKDSRLEARSVECVLRVVHEVLEMERLEPSEVALFIPPPLSPESIDALSDKLRVGRDRFVQVNGGGEDLFTSAIPYALDVVRHRGLAQPGDIALIISAGAGIEVGCATYYF